MSTYLIAGGAGFIGSHICKKLLDNDTRVICVDNLLTGNRKNIASFENNQNFTFIQADIVKDNLQIDEKIDVIIHLASPASPNHHSNLSYHAHPLETMLVNTTGTLNLLEIAEKNKSVFLFASTSEVYGDPLQHPQKEEYRGNVSTTGPRSVYDEAKRFGETITAYFHRDRNVSTRIVRIFNTYGPNMQIEDRRMIVEFITQALHNEPITVFGDGSQTRSLCYVEDLVEGLLAFIVNENVNGEIINIGSEDEHTVMEYAQIVKELTGSSSEIKLSEDLPTDDPLKRRPDISKAKRLLNWEPHTSLRDGLSKTIDYFKNIA